MKRDNELIRNILLAIEDCPDVSPNVLRIESFLDFCNEPAVISMHIELLKEAGLVEAHRILRSDKVKGWEVERLTFSGYEYLETIRSAKVWRNVKERMKAVGGATLEIIKAVAIDEVKRELNL